MAIAALLKAGFVGQPLPVGAANPGGLLSLWLQQQLFVALHPGFVQFLSIVVLTGSALVADGVVNSRRMFNRRHLLVSVSVVLFTSLFPPVQLFNPGTLMLPLSILLFSQITALYTTTRARTTIVNIGMLAGLGYLLYHPFLFVLPICFIGLSTMRPFKLSEWLLMLLGLLAPAYFILSIQYLSNNWQPMQHLPNFSFTLTRQVWSWYAITATAVASIWLLAGLSSWQQQTRRMLIQGRKNWTILLTMGFLCLPGLFFPTGNTASMLTLLAFPAGSIMANAFVADKKAIGQLLWFWMLIATAALVTWAFKQGWW